MPSWNSRGLRGSMLEEQLNLTNEKYRDKKLALIQKVPTPITPIEIDKEHRHITLAYFGQKSTVDYIGAVQGIPVCFDAKECANTRFALKNVHAHQIQFMKEFEEQGGIAFLLIYFTKLNCFYYLTFVHLYEYWQRSENGGRKSICFEELDPDYAMPNQGGLYIPYLKLMQKDLKTRDQALP